MILSGYSIAIDARPLAGDAINGYYIYTKALARLLHTNGAQVTLVTNQPINEAALGLGGCSVALVPPARGIVWEQWRLLRYLSRNQFDAYVAASNRGLPFFYRGKSRLILGLLDVIPLRFPNLYLTNRKQSLAYRLRLRLDTAKAAAIITISEASKRDIQTLLHKQQVYAHLIPLDIQKPAAATPRKQFIYIGGIDPRKQVSKLIEAFGLFRQKHPDYALVLVGDNYQAVRDQLAPLGDAVKITGYISDADKAAELAASVALVYPSLYEGYGLGVAEAFVAGIPAIIGAGGSQAEVGGEAVLYIDPENVQDIASAMEQMLTSEVQARLGKARKLQLAKLTDPAIEQQIAQTFKKIMRAK